MLTWVHISPLSYLILIIHTCYKKQTINARMCLNTHACNIGVYNINGTITSRPVSMLNKCTCWSACLLKHTSTLEGSVVSPIRQKANPLYNPIRFGNRENFANKILDWRIACANYLQFGHFSFQTSPLEVFFRVFKCTLEPCLALIGYCFIFKTYPEPVHQAIW